MADYQTKEKDADEDDSDEELLILARKRFSRAQSYWNTIYADCKDDTRFYAGNPDNGYQWPQQVIDRIDPKRPRLTINKLTQFHNHVVNDYRQASISMRASPVGEEDEKVAKFYEGTFRQIEKESYAQIAYIKGLSDGATGGVGYIRLVAEYDDDTSFDQSLKIKRFVNPFRSYPDPSATGFFLEDANFWFVVDTMPKEEYEDLYGDEPADFAADEHFNDWRRDQDVVICEYFYFVHEDKTVYQYADGEITTEKREGEKAVKQRKARVRTLHWCKMDGYKVLERTVWARPRIPIVPVWGNEIWNDDERIVQGLVRPLKDSQRMYNYMESTKTEMIALAPKSPYIAAEGQLENREDEWKDASTTPKSFLYYKPIVMDGVIVPPPMRQSYEAPVQAIIQASMQASDNMKAAIGVYDASLGARGNEVSGRAINARKAEGETATYNFVDNLSFAIGYLARCAAELFPVYYDTERMVRILGEDGKVEMMKINGEEDDSPNIVDSRYDLVLDTGPSFSTQREEAVAVITELSHNYPKLMEVGGDIAISNMNFKGAREIAARLKRSLPPEVVGPDEDPVTKLMAVSGEFEKAKAIIEELTGVVQEQKQELTQKDLELKNKAGELRIKQQEVDIKKQELSVKQQEVREGKAQQSDANAVAGDLYKLISQLSEQIAELADMVEAAVDETGAEPLNAPEASPTPVQPTA